MCKDLEELVCKDLEESRDGFYYMFCKEKLNMPLYLNCFLASVPNFVLMMMTQLFAPILMLCPIILKMFLKMLFV